MRDESRIRVLIAEDEAHLGTLLGITNGAWVSVSRCATDARTRRMKAESYDVALRTSYPGVDASRAAAVRGSRRPGRHIITGTHHRDGRSAP